MSELAEVMLSVSERTRLSELEGVVEVGLATFVEVGKALQEIRDERLHRQTNDTFEGYCQERWGFVASRARQLIAAAEVASVTSVTPTNEAQARELVPLKNDPQMMREAWKEANSNGTPTAEKVREAVQSRTNKPRAEPDYEACPVCGRPMRADKPARGGP